MGSARGTLGIAVEESEGVTSKLYKPAPVLVGPCKGSRRHRIQQHPQDMRDCDPHILPPWFAPSLYTTDSSRLIRSPHCWTSV